MDSGRAWEKIEQMSRSQDRRLEGFQKYDDAIGSFLGVGENGMGPNSHLSLPPGGLFALRTGVPDSTQALKGMTVEDLIAAKDKLNRVRTAEKVPKALETEPQAP